MRLLLSAVLCASLFVARPAEATDPSLIETDFDTYPDLLHLFRRQRPIMGECPMGETQGVPAGKHLLHLGTTGFYLDYANVLVLSPEQRRELRGIRAQALSTGHEQDKAVKAAEEELWRLSGAPEPEAELLKTQVERIAVLRAEQRWTYLDAVRRAASILSKDQRRRLVGTLREP